MLLASGSVIAYVAIQQLQAGASRRLGIRPCSKDTHGLSPTVGRRGVHCELLCCTFPHSKGIRYASPISEFRGVPSELRPSMYSRPMGILGFLSLSPTEACRVSRSWLPDSTGRCPTRGGTRATRCGKVSETAGKNKAAQSEGLIRNRKSKGLSAQSQALDRCRKTRRVAICQTCG